MRRSHVELFATVATLGADKLGAQSGAAEWTVAQVLSHLGSAAELGILTLQAAIDGGPPADRDALAPPIWDRWNAMSPSEMASNSDDYGNRVVALFESLDDDALENLRIDIGFMPAPIDVATLASFRLSELALHGWDVHVAFDPSATVAGHTVPLLLTQLPMMGGFFARPIGRSATVVLETTDPSATFTLELTDQGGQMREGAAVTDDRVQLPGEALMRLTAGRLAPDHTPASVTVDGAVTLDDLRKVFPGY